MHLEELTRQLEQLYKSGQRYRFIEQAHRVLAQVSDAPEVAGLTLRALVELGLGGPARELLQLRGDLRQFREDERLSEALTTLPHGRETWTDQAETFHANMAALCKTRPHLREFAADAEKLLADMQVYKTLDGSFYVSRREPGRLREWRTDLTGPPAEKNLKLPPRQQIGAAIIAGLRAGPFRQLYETTDRAVIPRTTPIYVIEPDPVRFAASLHCLDWTGPFADNRLFFFVGPDAVDQFAQLLHAEPNLATPATVVNCSDDPGISEGITAAVERIERSRRDELDRLIAQVHERYRERDVAYWAEHLAPPGLVLGITSRFTTMLQYSTRDALHAFSGLGYETHMLIESEDHHVLSPITVFRTILEVDPAAVLLLDHLRYEMPQLPENVPLITWIQDPMPNLLCDKAGASIGPLDFVCGYYADRCIGQHGYPREQFKSTEMPVSMRVFHDAAPSEGEARQYACDVSFVSNASMPIERLLESAQRDFAPAYRPLLKTIYDRVSAALDQGAYLSFHETAAVLVRSVAAEHGLGLDDASVDRLKTSFAFRLFDWGRRQQTLEWVADWARRTGRCFKIYGRGWDAHPTLSEFACGVIEHGEPLRLANQGSTLGLQLIATGFRHQRSYELLACGALPLTRLSPPDFANLEPEEFHRRKSAGEKLACSASIFPGFERVVFSTAAQFVELAERFLDDDAYRETVRDEFMAVVARDCTYSSVIRRVMETFRRHVATAAERQLTTVH